MPNKTTAGFDATEYMRKYIHQKIIYKYVHFTRANEEDMALLEWLEAQPEKAAPYIKRLIREDMGARAAPK